MATGKNIPNRPGPLPGRQTEVPNAGDEFPAARDLKRAKDLPPSVRDRIREVDIQEDARGLRDTGDLGAPLGDHQESRRRGTHQEKE
jgi:hypothetical protein